MAASERANWKIEDIISGDKQLDFSKSFLPESLARVEPQTFLDSDVETRAFMPFANEEAKHIQLFNRFCRAADKSKFTFSNYKLLGFCSESP